MNHNSPRKALASSAASVQYQGIQRDRHSAAFTALAETRLVHVPLGVPLLAMGAFPEPSRIIQQDSVGRGRCGASFCRNSTPPEIRRPQRIPLFKLHLCGLLISAVSKGQGRSKPKARHHPKIKPAKFQNVSISPTRQLGLAREVVSQIGPKLEAWKPLAGGRAQRPHRTGMIKAQPQPSPRPSGHFIDSDG